MVGGILMHTNSDWLVDAAPDGMVHGDNMGPIWGRQDPGGPNVGPMNFVIMERFSSNTSSILGILGFL